MKLEVGMYVRTEDGEISKIEWFTFQSWEGLDTVEANFWLENKQRLMYPLDNFKASHNIIDLIEEGDYVNGMKVVQVGDRYFYMDSMGLNDDFEEVHWKIPKQPECILSIVTKEQFESMAYKVGE